MKTNKRNLILIAAIVWMIAGFNVFRIGVNTYNGYLTFINMILSLGIYLIFYFIIFRRMVDKHCTRIESYINEQYFWKFLDMKALLIMLFMFSFGLLIRLFNLLPDKFIAIFYTGLGMALFLAGISFIMEYFKLFKEKSEG